MSRYITSAILVLIGARTWWLCTKYSGIDGWVSSIAGMVVILVGVYNALNLPMSSHHD